MAADQRSNCQLFELAGTLMIQFVANMKIWENVNRRSCFLLLAVLIGPFLVPVAALSGTVDEKQLADADSNFTQVHGIDVHYKKMGSGPVGTDQSQPSAGTRAAFK